MKLINKDGKLFSKINIMDIIIVLLVVAAVMFIGSKMTGSTQDTSLKTAEYEFEMEKVRIQTVEAWQKNALGVLDAETKDAMGDIVKISYKPARELVKQSDGTYVIAEHSEKYDVTLTLRVGVNETDKGFYTADNIYIAPGKTLGLSNGFAQTFGEITSLNIK